MASSTSWLDSLLDLVYPPHCLVCTKPGAYIHPACQEQMPYLREPLCSGCGIPSVLDASGQFFQRCASPICTMPASQRALDRVSSVFAHNRGGREAALRLKYKGVANLARRLGIEMAATARQRQLHKLNLVVPVPLHQQRLRERGYNQAALLAQALGHELQLDCREKQLVRQRATSSQVGLGLAQRAANVKAAFVWQGPSLKGQTVILVDDVCTTGATLNACAAALKEAGASQVQALTLTREFPK
jgi:ComF family protein